VPAAEAKKAGVASEVTLLTPRPPCLIGMEAYYYYYYYYYYYRTRSPQVKNIMLAIGLT